MSLFLSHPKYFRRIVWAILVFCSVIMAEWLFLGHSLLKSNPFLKELSFYTALLGALCCALLLLKNQSLLQTRITYAGLLVCGFLFIPGLQPALSLGNASHATLYAFGFLFTSNILARTGKNLRLTSLVFLMYSIVQFVGVIGVSRYLLQVDSASGSGIFQFLSPSTSLVFLLLTPLMFAQTTFNIMDLKAEHNLAHQNMALALFLLPLGISTSALLANSVQFMLDSNAGAIPLMLGTSTFLGSFFLYLFGSYAGEKEKEVTTKLRAQAQELEVLHTQRIKAAEALASEQSRFSSVLAHEIRTPLSTVLGLVELLRSKHAEDLKSIGCDKKFKQIETSSKLLREMINSVLDYTKIKAGKLALNPQPHNVPELLEELAFLYATSLQDKVLSLKIEPNPAVTGLVTLDRARVRGILSNLIDNAIKFTPTGGTINISFEIKATEGSDLLLIKVKDSGIGLREDQQTRIFQPFKQASDDTVNKYGGTGLGLSYSRELARIMHGDLTVKSTLGLGSEFCLTLPVTLPAKPVAGQTGNIPSIGSQHEQTGMAPVSRLLMVEDHELNAEIHTMLLNDVGITVDWAISGEEALRMFEENQSAYQAILMDIQLGEGMDGLQTTTALLEQYGSKLPPVLAMTAGTSDSELHNIEEAGMVGIIAKPLDIKEAVATINSVVRSSKTPR